MWNQKGGSSGFLRSVNPSAGRARRGRPSPGEVVAELIEGERSLGELASRFPSVERTVDQLVADGMVEFDLDGAGQRVVRLTETGMSFAKRRQSILS